MAYSLCVVVKTSTSLVRECSQSFINSMAEIKKACAICNCQVGELDVKIKDAICQACDEIIAGKLHDQFLCDPIQGGAGTTANMTANEVIANRAIEILGGTKAITPSFIQMTM